jgi:hypothetical protein
MLLVVAGFVAYAVSSNQVLALTQAASGQRIASHSGSHHGRWRHRHRPPVSQSPSPSPTAKTSPSPIASPTSSPSTSPSGGTSADPGPTGTAAGCSGASNTPGGGDPWGGCWPGADNTGVPRGTVLTNYQGNCKITADNTVIDADAFDCGLVVTGSNVTIKDSQINGTVMNDGPGHLLIEDTTINGGSDHSESVGGSDITILRSNLFGDQHEVYCGSDCTVEDSWLHDNFNGAAMGWHQNSFLSTGGNNYDLEHNSVYCTGGCTSDIAFIPNDDVTNATVDKNLFVAAPDAAYCLYPSSAVSKPGTVSEMTVTNNMFQPGANGKCATFGPVYGWDTPVSSAGANGFRNVWSNNKWVTGALISPS